MHAQGPNGFPTVNLFIDRRLIIEIVDSELQSQTLGLSPIWFIKIGQLMQPRKWGVIQRECEASCNPLSKLLNQFNFFFRKERKSFQQEWAENLHLSPPPKQISGYFHPQQES